jgi:hypothetical protein
MFDAPLNATPLINLGVDKVLADATVPAGVT